MHDYEIQITKSWPPRTGWRHPESKVREPNGRSNIRYLMAAAHNLIRFIYENLSVLVPSPWQKDGQHRNESSRLWLGSACMEFPSRGKTL